jgi:hypothetical protein
MCGRTNKSSQFLCTATKLDFTVDQDVFDVFGRRGGQGLPFGRPSHGHRLDSGADGSATASGWDFGSSESARPTDLDFHAGGNTIVPLSVFFPWLTRTLAVTRIDDWVFESPPISLIKIPRHVEILCSDCFSDCNSLSPISFETDSKLTRIESKVYGGPEVGAVKEKLPNMRYFLNFVLI